jgi:hypothetical protein
MRAIGWFVVVATTAALQQAVDACPVTIARAPDDVRVVVEAWLAAEPACVIPLEVRIVTTDRGLYVIAHDARGRVHERIVPDADTAAALIASWTADDGLGPPARVIVDAPPPPIEARAAVAEHEPVAPTGGTPSREPTRRWISLGAMARIQPMGRNGPGARARVDVLARGAWALEINGAVSSGTIQAIYGPGVFVDAKLGVAGAGQITFGRWRARAAIGGGFSVVSLSVPLTSTMQANNMGVVPFGELALSLGRDLGDRWGFEIGPLLAKYGDLPIQTPVAHFGHTDLMLVGALRRSL